MQPDDSTLTNGAYNVPLGSTVRFRPGAGVAFGDTDFGGPLLFEHDYRIDVRMTDFSSDFLEVSIESWTCRTGPDGGGGGPSACPGTIEGTHPTINRDPPTINSDPPFLGFPNHGALCRGFWVPTLDAGFIPQGLALGDDGTALISGYMCTRDPDRDDGDPRCPQPAGVPYCRIIRVDLSTGALLGQKELKDGPAVFPANGWTPRCRHAGGIATQGSQVWVADTGHLMLLNSELLFGDQDPVVKHCQTRKTKKSDAKNCRYTIELDGMDGSFLAERGSSLWVGDFTAEKMYEFPYASLLDPTTITIGKKAKKDVLGPTSVRSIAAKPQGADFKGDGLWVASSRSDCGRLSFFPVVGPPSSWGFGPGVEEIEFAPDGGLWAVFEAGSMAYPSSRLFPVIARFDPTLITEAPDCAP